MKETQVEDVASHGLRWASCVLSRYSLSLRDHCSEFLSQKRRFHLERGQQASILKYPDLLRTQLGLLSMVTTFRHKQGGVVFSVFTGDCLADLLVYSHWGVRCSLWS